MLNKQMGSLGGLEQQKPLETGTVHLTTLPLPHWIPFMAPPTFRSPLTGGDYFETPSYLAPTL